MVRLFLLTLTCLLGTARVAAQDRLLLRTADEVQVRVTEITDREVLYRRVDEPSGPVRSISRAEVFSIIYADGSKELFAADPQGYPFPRIRRAYREGEYFDEDGVRGLVVHTTDGGRHGLVLSLEEGLSLWGGVWGDELSESFRGFDCRCVDRNDGWKNMQAVEEVVAHVSGLSWSNFPAFDWCRKLGPGWYLPAADEMDLLWRLGRTGSASDSRRAMFDSLELLLKGINGQRMRRIMAYWTSTESDDPDRALLWNTPQPGATADSPKRRTLYLRAFHKF